MASVFPFRLSLLFESYPCHFQSFVYLLEFVGEIIKLTRELLSSSLKLSKEKL